MTVKANETGAPYKVTAVVSIYKAERFLRACLEDLVAQTLFSQTEVIIIDAHSPEQEKLIAEEFTEKYSNIKYIRTSERETLYASWNRAIKMAQGTYITNANADDRHARHAFERLAAELDAHSEVALVYADCRITHTPNALFDTAPIVGYMRWLPYDYLNVLRRCEMGPQPMWRRSAHDTVGFFDENYVVAGDYDMWLRMGAHYPFRHIPQELGLYLQHEHNLETQNTAETNAEIIRTQIKALQYFMGNDVRLDNSLEHLRAEHKQRLLRYLCNMENGTVVKNQNKLAYHIFAYVLLSLKLRSQVMQVHDLYQDFVKSPPQADASYLRNLLR